MPGFFTKKQTESKSRPNGKNYSCVSCGLYKDCKTPKMQVSGGFKKGILNIGTSPSKIDDRHGEPFKDKFGKYLESAYKKHGIDLYEDCLNTNAINCLSSSKPTQYQIESCRKFIIKAIETYKPKVIVLFGGSALISVIGNQWKKDLGSIFKWQGWQIPDQDFNAWICPTFSPSFVMNSKNKVESVLWNKDLNKVAELVNTPLRIHKEPEIIYLKKDLTIFDSIIDGEVVIDYEGTGLKPHAKGHKITTISVAVNVDFVYVFMVPKKRKHLQPFLDLMKRKEVGKIAQNMKYEDIWTNVIFGITIQNWVWDTMLASHIIDNRKSITSLKFQTYIQFGIADYDSEISPYLKAKDEKNTNALNQIDELIKRKGGKKMLMKYCALDSIFEFRLAQLQRKIINRKQPKGSKFGSNVVDAYKLFHDGALAFSRSEQHGLHIDVELLEIQKKKLTKHIKRIETKIYESKFYKDWNKYTKGKPSLNSPDQLSKYLYNTLNIKPYKLTKTGKGSTDIDSLKMLGIPALKLMLKRSSYLQLRDTFLNGIHREQVDGILHFFLNLHLVVTYRGSSSKINFQNLPNRDEYQMEMIRSCIIPSKGNQLFEMDFSGIEVAVGAAYHKDPKMIEYVSDPKSDMHGDMAEQIFMIDKFDINKHKEHNTLRKCAKNSFVFPEFYGSYYKSCAEYICRDWTELPARKWKKKDGIFIDSDTTIGNHLISKGIKSYDNFINHLQEIEKDFWGNRFKVYDEWKQDQWKMYQKYGYIPLKTGFVCSALMGERNVGNSPIQGTAFHCLLWTYIEVEKELMLRNLKTKPIGQIHDAIVFDLYPPELHEVHRIVQQIGTIKLPEAFKWLNVPLRIKAELCPVDGSWAEREDWNPEIYYYFHDKSNCLYSSYNDPNIEVNPNGYEVEHLTKKEAVKLAKRFEYTIDKTGYVLEDLPF